MAKEHVKHWQRTLGGLVEDGDFGPRTERASLALYEQAYPDAVPPTARDGSADPTGATRWALSKSSQAQLRSVHADLQRVVRLALSRSPVDFGVSEGLRDVKTQIRNVEKGASRTMNSRHLHGCAVDLVAYVDGKISWKKWPYEEIRPAMFEAAGELGVPLRWGGDWNQNGVPYENWEWDLGHYELEKAKYPDEQIVIEALRRAGLVH